MFEFLKSLRHYWDGDSYVKPYEKAISAANIYLPVRPGPGNAKLGAALLNEILGEDFLKGNGVEAFGRRIGPW
jgi:hypothetical protein